MIDCELRFAVYCMDCKLLIDPNAEFRQKELFALQDTKQEDELEVSQVMSKSQRMNHPCRCAPRPPISTTSAWTGTSVVSVRSWPSLCDCSVNGAGLAMATMDIIKLHGGEPANFLDVGGGATVEQVTEAFKIITADKQKVGLLHSHENGVQCVSVDSRDSREYLRRHHAM